MVKLSTSQTKNNSLTIFHYFAINFLRWFNSQLKRSIFYLQYWPDDGEKISALSRLIHTQLEKHPNLDPGINHAPNSKHWKNCVNNMKVAFISTTST